MVPGPDASGAPTGITLEIIDDQNSANPLFHKYPCPATKFIMPRPHGPNLVAWLGRTDLNAITRADEIGVGPICQAVTARSFERVDLLSNFSPQEGADYLAWLRPKTQAHIHLHPVHAHQPHRLGGDLRRRYYGRRPARSPPRR
jgi:hypothetical protein